MRKSNTLTLEQAVEANKTKRVRVVDSKTGVKGTWFDVKELSTKYDDAYPMWLIKSEFEADNERHVFTAKFTNGMSQPILMFADDYLGCDKILKELAARKVKTQVTIEVLDG